MGFFMFFCFSILGSLFTMWVVNRLPRKVLLRCSACGSELTVVSRGWWTFLESMVWLFVAWFVVLRLDLPIGIKLLLIFVLSRAWHTATQRLVHSYWVWRHPLRCQGEGHTELLPQGTQ